MNVCPDLIDHGLEGPDGVAIGQGWTNEFEHAEGSNDACF